MNNGWLSCGDKDKIWLTKDGLKTAFDVKIKTKEGTAHAMKVKHQADEMAMVAETTTDHGTKMSIQEAHQKLSHSSEAVMRETAKCHGWIVMTEKLGPCVDCLKGKAKQKNAPKEAEHVATKPAE